MNAVQKLDALYHETHFLPLQLTSHVVGRSAEALPGQIVADFGGHSEVSDLGAQLLVQKHVLQLQVSVHVLLRVDVLHARHDLQGTHN